MIRSLPGALLEKLEAIGNIKIFGTFINNFIWYFHEVQEKYLPVPSVSILFSSVFFLDRVAAGQTDQEGCETLLSIQHQHVV